MVIALLSALMLWISRGRGERANALQSINQSARLGPGFAKWIEVNEEKLHTLLASRSRQGGGGAGRVAESAKAARNAGKTAAKGVGVDEVGATRDIKSPGDGVVVKPFRGKIRFRSAKDVHEELLDKGRVTKDTLPFKDGTTITEREMMPGERFKMSMDDDQLRLLKDPNKMEGLGGWGSKETFGSQAEALDKMAIRPGWKPNGIPNTVELEVVKPFRTLDGVAGPQPPLGGGAQQYFLDLPQATAKEYVRIVNVTTLP